MEAATWENIAMFRILKAFGTWRNECQGLSMENMLRICEEIIIVVIASHSGLFLLD